MTTDVLIREWAKAVLHEAEVNARESAPASRRAFHDGIAAAVAAAAGDRDKALRLVDRVLVDYTGARATQARRGYEHGAAMLRGVVDYVERNATATLAEWEGERA